MDLSLASPYGPTPRSPPTRREVTAPAWVTVAIFATAAFFGAEVSNAASASAEAIKSSPARACTGDAGFLHSDLRCHLLDFVMMARRSMAIEGFRRWAAVGILSLTSFVLHSALDLHRERWISHTSLRNVLSGTRWLERLGEWLVLGARRQTQQTDRDLRSERID
ncbi:hypothetical protein ACE10Z_02390 [Bradyrhizobium sp. Pha-3]|uniref:hypothetical protein n=1 Tax=Bradyrhizobium sp. Pha-3 TaxID=208375 RepID=UPI0035D4E130